MMFTSPKKDKAPDPKPPAPSPSEEETLPEVLVSKPEKPAKKRTCHTSSGLVLCKVCESDVFANGKTYHVGDVAEFAPADVESLPLYLIPVD